MEWAAVSKATREEWWSGIQANLELQAFRAAWAQLRSKAPKRFTELQEMTAQGFLRDPPTWPALRAW